MPDCFCLCAVLLGLLILTLAGCIFYSGLLADITVKTSCPTFNKLTFAYKFKEGAYKDSGELLKEARCIGLGLPCLGVFYEDPKKICAPLCRYAVGCILSEGENKVDEELLKQCKSSGFSVFSFPQVTHVISTSFRHTALFSTYFRVRRVYPQLERYIKERRLCAHPFLELYRDGQIQFIVPLARQGDFYVPEVRQAERSLSEQEEFHSDTDISGADSNSEYSSGSGILLSDSRETSSVASSVRSVPVRDQGSGDNKGRSSGGAQFKEPKWEWSGGVQKGRGQHGEPKEESLEVSTEKLWGVVGEEE
ncbi:testis-expressed protein 264 homolog isoform X1 [Gambusia affinis]|uniref:testis-expressed protein 264 homolog isoform X1 n=1 Tax=Gambusia affinis TaxID=33528 RepID=UPI000F38BB91|nr:testis-expressed protein 264 homolog isoform X1 [Gambusia affinis]